MGSLNIGKDGRDDLREHLKDFESAHKVIAEAWAHIRKVRSVDDIAEFIHGPEMPKPHGELANAVRDFIDAMDDLSDVATCVHESELHERRCLNLCPAGDYCDEHAGLAVRTEAGQKRGAK